MPIPRLCQPVAIFVILLLLVTCLLEGGLCFFATPTPMKPNSAPYHPGGSGGGGAAHRGGGGGSTWAALASAPSNSGVDLSRYVQQTPRRGFSSSIGATAPPPHRRRKAPIYIPVGPPCAGKTTILSRILVPANVSASNELANSPHHPTVAERTAGRDVSIDDQDGVYMQIPTHLFLVDDPTTSKTNVADAKLLNQTVHGKTVYERLYSDGANDELRVVLRRLAGRITQEEFREAIMRQMGCWNATKEADNSISGVGGISNANVEADQSARLVGRHGGPLQIPASTMAKYLIDAVEHFAEIETLTSSGRLRDANQPILGPDGCTDLFVVEAIFRSSDVVEGGRYRTRPPGLNLAIANMERLACNSSALPPDVPLAWGNTNTRPREYTSALEIAQKSGRPVVFIPHVNPTVVSVQEEGGPGNPSELLHHVELDELYLRSIRRLVHTGRYVPATAIKDAAFRCDSLMLSAKAEMGRIFPTTQTNKLTDPITSGNDGTSVNPAEATRTFTKFQLECSLAKMAGYQLNADRTVVKIRQDGDNDSRGERGGYNGGSGRASGVNSYGQGQYRSGRGDRGGGYGRGYGRGYDGRNGGRSWHSGQGWQQQQQGDRSRGYEGTRWANTARYDRNDQQKRSYDGRQWSPSRRDHDCAGNRTGYPR